jgi:TolB-like protein/Tfp pilus assembly protein PilF
MMLDIRLLGQPEIHRDGHKLSFPRSRKTLALLAYLIVTARSQSRNHLCDLLWKTPDDPRAALRWSLSRLRPLLEDNLESDRNQVFFNSAGAEIDVLALKKLKIEELERTELNDLNNLFNGEFLEGLTLNDCEVFDAWRIAVADEFKQIQKKILGRLILLAGSDIDAALEHARELLAIDGSVDSRTILEKLRHRKTVGSENGISIAPFDHKPVVAVLPFENLTNDSEHQYLVDGITMDVTSYLSKFRAASVISRGFQVDVNESVADVAGRFGVRYLVKGGVERSQNRIRMSVQLVDSESGQNVWGEVYDRQIEDLLSIRDELSHRIVSMVQPEFTAAEAQRVQRKSIQDLDAWENYMRATWYLSRFTRKDNQRAQQHAERAIELDPKGAGAYAIKSVTHLMDAVYGWRATRSQAMDLGRSMARTALRLDDRDAQVVRVVGLVNLYARNHDQAKQDFLRAIELNPDEAENYVLLGLVIGLAGDYEGATSYIERALELSPRDQFRATWYSHHAMVAVISGRYQQAVDLANAALAQNPEFLGGFRTLAVGLAYLDRKDEAGAAIRELNNRLPEMTLKSVAEQLPFADSASQDRYIQGLRLAGLL